MTRKKTKTTKKKGKQTRLSVSVKGYTVKGYTRKNPTRKRGKK